MDATIGVSCHDAALVHASSVVCRSGRHTCCVSLQLCLAAQLSWEILHHSVAGDFELMMSPDAFSTKSTGECIIGCVCNMQDHCVLMLQSRLCLDGIPEPWHHLYGSPGAYFCTKPHVITPAELLKCYQLRCINLCMR